MKRSIIAFTLSIAGLVSGCVGNSLESTREERILGAWREEQVALLDKWTDDPRWLETELATIRKTLKSSPNDGTSGFFTGKLVLMSNGEWIAYSYRCCHGGERDLFIGLDQYGKWYYTNFHFCSSMINLADEDQSDSIQAFVKEYHLRVFDRNSNEFMKLETKKVRTRD